MKINKEDLINAIGRLPIGWSIEDTGEAFLLTTRESGNVGEETAGKSDIEMGRRILGILRKSFPDAENKSSAEVVDEWVIVSIGKGGENSKSQIADLEKKIRYAVRNSQYDAQLERYPRWFIDVLVESPSRKGFYLIGELDGQYQADAWDERYGQGYYPPVLITSKNGKPFAVKIPESMFGWYDDIARRNGKLPTTKNLRPLIVESLKRRMELESTIKAKISSQGPTTKEEKDLIKIKAFIDYKNKYLGNPKPSLLDESNKFIVRSKLLSNPRAPKAVSRVACRGLKKRRKYKRGGTAVGVARARDLCGGRNVSMRSIKRMYSYFSRHRASRLENARRISDPTSPARIADELWGGTPGYRWAKRARKA